MVAYRCRYEPFNKEMIRMAREQELGPVKVIVADHGFNIGDPTQWRLKKEFAGGGSLMDIGIYSLQAARYITGEEPTEINAMTYTTPGDCASRRSRRRSTSSSASPAASSPTAPRATDTPGRTVPRDRTKGWFELEPATSYTGLHMRTHATTPEDRNCPSATISRSRWTTLRSASWTTRTRSPPARKGSATSR